jgi:hypothetical protein
MPSSAQQGADATTQPAHRIDQMDAATSTPDFLAQKTQAWSKEMDNLITGRRAPSPVPSVVQFANPGDLTLETGSVRSSNDSTSRGPGANVRNVNENTSVVPTQTGPSGPGPAQSDPVVNPIAPRPVTLQSSDTLSDKLARRVKDYPRDVSAQLEYQLLRFLLDDQVPQPSALSYLPSEDREMVTAVLDGLTNFRNALRADSNMLLSKKIKPILEMADRLRAQADLTIPTIALCTRVVGFGAYDPIEPLRFPANADNRAIVYCEIANFTSTLNDKQMWETRLTCDMTLYTDTGMSVWAAKTENVTDAARNRRHDFFVTKHITLPKALTIGRYLLKASIVDTQANRVAEANVPLVIVAQ